MRPIGVGVDNVVHQVAGARDQAHHDEGQPGPSQDRRHAEQAGGSRRREHQRVLHPLLRSKGHAERMDAAALANRRIGGRDAAWWLHHRWDFDPFAHLDGSLRVNPTPAALPPYGGGCVADGVKGARVELLMNI